MTRLRKQFWRWCRVASAKFSWWAANESNSAVLLDLGLVLLVVLVAALRSAAVTGQARAVEFVKSDAFGEIRGQHVEEKLCRLRGAFHDLKKVTTVLAHVAGENGGEVDGLTLTHDGLETVVGMVAQGEAERSVTHVAHPEVFAYRASSTFRDIRESVRTVTNA